MEARIYEIDEYQVQAKSTAVYPSERALEYLSLGLASEAGEVASLVSKWVRGDKKEINVDDMRKELGDVLWFVSVLGEELKLDLSEIAMYNIDKLADRKKRGVIKGDGDNR